jgi:hypothetical protein
MEAIITGFSIWIIIKILILVILAMYIVFAFVITRQVNVMTNTLTLGFEPVVRFLAFVHLAFSVIVFITAIIVL